jgi:hypothetical protein
MPRQSVGFALAFGSARCGVNGGISQLVSVPPTVSGTCKSARERGDELDLVAKTMGGAAGDAWFKQVEHATPCGIYSCNVSNTTISAVHKGRSLFLQSRRAIPKPKCWQNWRADADGNIRLAGLPLDLTKRMAHVFTLAPGHFSIEQALRWSQVVGQGGADELAHAVLQTPLGGVLTMSLSGQRSSPGG